MKLGIKLALSTICVVSILFGICGATISSINFQNTLDREEEAAKDSYVSLLEVLGVLESSGIIYDYNNAREVLYRYDSGGWAAISIWLDGQLVYDKDPGLLLDKTEDGDDVKVPDSGARDPDENAEGSSGDASSSSASDDGGASEVSVTNLMRLQEIDGRTYISIRGNSYLGSSVVTVAAMRDVTFVYDSRVYELHLFSVVFAILVLASAAASFLSAYIITRPLSRLSKATREIAANNLSSRSRVRTDDEIGALSKDFDDMASRLEAGVNDMQSMLNRQKSFMGSFAHEMKTPMTSVIGYADLIRQGLLNDTDSERAAHYMFNEGKRLESLSSKLLEMFLVEDGGIERQPVDMAALIDSVLEPLVKPFYDIEVQLIWNVQPYVLEVDEGLVRSLLVNFIENAKRAVSETQAPRIFVKGSVKEGFYEVSVTDNGRGIPKEDLGRITEEFYRVDKARSRKSGGAGLGLSLCVRIVQAHKGTMSIESSVGKGTCVRAKFPIEGAREAIAR